MMIPTSQLKTYTVIYDAYIGTCYARDGHDAIEVVNRMADISKLSIGDHRLVFARPFDPTSSPMIEIRVNATIGYADD